MAEIAIKRNRELVRARRVEVAIAGVDALSFPNDAFDKAVCVHVVYFWSGIAAAFREIASILKLGGRLALVFKSSADEAAVQAFPADVYRFPATGDVLAALTAAGLVINGTDERDGRPVLMIATK